MKPTDTNGIANGVQHGAGIPQPPPGMLEAPAAPATPRRPRKKRIRGIDGAERLDAAQLERLIGNCRRTIERWILTKGFPGPRYLGRKRLWLVSEVRAWIAQNERSGATPPEDPA